MPPAPEPTPLLVSTWPPAVAHDSAALTFSVGLTETGTGYVTSILDILAARGVVATFAIRGDWANQNPAILQRIRDEGHQIINATYDFQPLTDLLMLLRYAFTFRGSTLVTGALGNGCVRCGADALEVFIASLGSLLDVDGNGAFEPLTDGLLFLRYGFGFRSTTLVTNAAAQNCTRCTAPQIEGHLDPLFP